jgi:hypothetical protein
VDLETTHSDGSMVPLGLPSSQTLQTDRGMILTPETIHLDSDDLVTKGPEASFELNLNRGKSLASWQNQPHFANDIPDIEDTPVINRRGWALGVDRAKMLPPSNPQVEDDEDGWMVLPYFGAALLFFSWIGQKGRRVIKRKEARLKFEPNAVRSIGFLSGGRRPALDESATTSYIAGARQKAPEEKKEVLLGHFSGDPGLQKARAKTEHAQETDETFDKDFNGTGLS